MERKSALSEQDDVGVDVGVDVWIIYYSKTKTKNERFDLGLVSCLAF